MAKRVTFLNKGDVFGYLTVVKEDNSDKTIRYVCKCSCGTVKSLNPYCLLNGRTKSCGCLKSEATKRFITHGRSSKGNVDKLYTVWQNMKARCNNENHRDYHLYGGRGIKVCKAWLNSFQTFAVDMGPRPENMSIDRKNNNKGYYPWNCHWVTREEQNNNTRVNVLVSYKGEQLTVAQASKLCGISQNILRKRIAKGISNSQLFKPAKKIKTIEYKGESLTLSEASRKSGLGRSALAWRIENKWPKKYLFKPSGYKLPK